MPSKLDWIPAWIWLLKLLAARFDVIAEESKSGSADKVTLKEGEILLMLGIMLVIDPPSVGIDRKESLKRSATGSVLIPMKGKTLQGWLSRNMIEDANSRMTWDTTNNWCKVVLALL